jgi:hypothetical protein
LGVCWGLTFFVGSFGFLVVLGCFFCFLGVCWGLIFVYLGFWGFSLSFGFPLFLWASWVVPLYTSCVLRALYAFFNKIFLLIKKKTQQCANQSGRYLAVTEYGSGGQRRFLVIPKGHKGRGWRSCASELRKVVDFLDMPYGKGNAPLSQWPFGGSTLYDVGNASLVFVVHWCPWESHVA